MCGGLDTFNGLEKLVSNIKGPIWFREKVDFNANLLIRKFLQECSKCQGTGKAASLTKK